MASILILFDSHSGQTAAMADAVARGALSVPGTTATLARIPPLAEADVLYGPCETPAGTPDATPDMLAQADGLAVGTPVHLGAPSAALVRFLAATGRLWRSRALAGKPAGVFTAAGSGGGAEAAILCVWSALASHGMLIVPGCPLAGGPEGAPPTAHGGGPFGAGTLAGYGGARPDKT